LFKNVVKPSCSSFVKAFVSPFKNLSNLDGVTKVFSNVAIAAVILSKSTFTSLPYAFLNSST